MRRRAYAPSPWARVLAAAFALAAASSLDGGAGAEAEAAPEAGCPAGLAPDAPRARALLEQIARVSGAPEGGAPRICFGRVPVSAITSDGVVLLDGAVTDARATARLAHLLRHRGDPRLVAPRGASDEACAAWLDAALAAEGEAYDLEMRVGAALGETPAYGFTAAYLGAAAAARPGVVVAFLRAHPYGGGGVDALAASYEARCRAARR